jgi:uncharacterized membrane protein
MYLRILGLGFDEFIFVFFSLGFTGWIAETINETAVRKKFINKGFFKGPFVLSHAIGGVGVYAVGFPLRASPPLVFLTGLIVCTALEYVMALFLERCFKVRCWDYRTYPHTRWCHFQGRIALTTSLFFGFITLFVVYFFWDFVADLAGRTGGALWLLDGALCALFFADLSFTCARILRANKARIKIRGYAVFSAPSGD